MKKIVTNVVLTCALISGPCAIISGIGNTSTIKKKAIIWDLGYTLVKPRKLSIANYLGLGQCMKLYLQHGKGMQGLLTERLFNVLEEDYSGVNEIGVKEPGGRLLPVRMTDWLEGKISSKETLKESFRLLDQQKEYWTDSEKQFLQKSLKLLFSPKLYAKNMKPLPLMRIVLQKCANNPDIESYIASNWDPDSFDLMYYDDSLRHIFRHFKKENIFISGFEKKVKPDPAFFHELLDKAKLNPQECIFIDDQEENIHAARKLGMTAIHFKEKRIRGLLRQLKEHGALKS